MSFAANRQVYGRWTTQLPSRFVDEMPAANVESTSETGYYGGGPGMEMKTSRWDDQPSFKSIFGGGYASPGWQRARDRGFSAGGGRGAPIEGEGRLVAVSSTATASKFTRGERVFHIKFGYGVVTDIEGNKLSVAFEKAGKKKVIDSFVESAAKS